jgi:protein-L-isoaspartate(D-aspartate) O-methyltransferase
MNLYLDDSREFIAMARVAAASCSLAWRAGSGIEISDCFRCGPLAGIRIPEGAARAAYKLHKRIKVDTDRQEPLPSDIMLREQLCRRGIHDRRVLDAMRKIPRERFVARDLSLLAYADRALAIGCGQTISQPYMVALMTESLELTGTESVLEIGTGSGYQTAVLAELAGRVVSIERHGALSREAGERLARLGYDNIELLIGDGTLGWPAEAPFERILVTAAADTCPPALIDQLGEAGVLVIPLGGRQGQVLHRLSKRDGQVVRDDLVPCRFVPLVGAAITSG